MSINYKNTHIVLRNYPQLFLSKLLSSSPILLTEKDRGGSEILVPPTET